VAHDVFDLDNRVIDQNAGAQCDCEETHEIERKSEQIHDPERGKD
jgi:hypothetical protein